MVFSNKKMSFLLILLIAVCITNTAGAQLSAEVIPNDLDGGYASYDTEPSENDIFVDISPQNPGAFQEVTLRTTSDYIDLNRYNASWYVDGRKIAGGIGERTIKVKTRNYGQRTTVVILIQLPDTLIKKTFSFEPQDMTIMWEAVDAYVPPFYEGKKLPPREGILKAVAIPNFKTADGRSFKSQNGVYRWERNGNVIAEASGYGKDSFSFKNNNIRSSEEMTVTASDISGNHEATQVIDVQTYQPKILFYEKNGRTGITSPFSKLTLDLTGDQSTVVAEPYFFSVVNNDPNTLGYTWTMNGNTFNLADINNKRTLTLQNPGGSGTANLGLALKNPNSLFQEVAANLKVAFGGN